MPAVFSIKEIRPMNRILKSDMGEISYTYFRRCAPLSQLERDTQGADVAHKMGWANR